MSLLVLLAVTYEDIKSLKNDWLTDNVRHTSLLAPAPS